MSFSREGNGTELENEMLNILGRHMLLVGSAGNENEGQKNYWPAYHPSVLAVGAHDWEGNRAVFDAGGKSNYQPYVLISAPGKDVWTTDMIGLTEQGFYYKGYVAPDPPNDPKPQGECYSFEGTSASAPIVSGIAAMTLGYNPGLTPAQLTQRVLSTRRLMELDPAEWGSGSAIGIVDAYSAVTGVTP